MGGVRRTSRYTLWLVAVEVSTLMLPATGMTKGGGAKGEEPPPPAPCPILPLLPMTPRLGLSPGANLSQIASSFCAYASSSCSHVVPARSNGTHWTNRALLWCPISSCNGWRFDLRMFECWNITKSCIGFQGSQPTMGWGRGANAWGLNRPGSGRVWCTGGGGKCTLPCSACQVKHHLQGKQGAAVVPHVILQLLGALKFE